MRDDVVTFKRGSGPKTSQPDDGPRSRRADDDGGAPSPASDAKSDPFSTTWAWPGLPTPFHCLALVLVHGLYTAYAMYSGYAMFGAPIHRELFFPFLAGAVLLIAPLLGFPATRSARGKAIADVRLAFPLVVFSTAVLHLWMSAQSNPLDLVELALGTAVLGSCLTSLVVSAIAGPWRLPAFAIGGIGFAANAAAAGLVLLFLRRFSTGLVPWNLAGAFLGLGALASWVRPFGVFGLAWQQLTGHGGPIDPALWWRPEGLLANIGHTIESMPFETRSMCHRAFFHDHSHAAETMFGRLALETAAAFPDTKEALLPLVPFRSSRHEGLNQLASFVESGNEDMCSSRWVTPVCMEARLYRLCSTLRELASWVRGSREAKTGDWFSRHLAAIAATSLFWFPEAGDPAGFKRLIHEVRKSRDALRKAHPDIVARNLDGVAKTLATEITSDPEGASQQGSDSLAGVLACVVVVSMGVLAYLTFLGTGR